jgi:hypothetical protein
MVLLVLRLKPFFFASFGFGCIVAFISWFCGTKSRYRRIRCANDSVFHSLQELIIQYPIEGQKNVTLSVALWFCDYNGPCLWLVCFAVSCALV